MAEVVYDGLSDKATSWISLKRKLNDYLVSVGYFRYDETTRQEDETPRILKRVLNWLVDRDYIECVKGSYVKRHRHS